MIQKKNIAVLLVLLLACIEPYELEIPETNKLLVVDASLTDEVKAHTVHLSYSYRLDESEGRPVSGATVWFKDQDETLIPLEEALPGYYVTDSAFSGIAGNRYTLHIETTDGKTYQSSEELLVSAPALDSIYGKIIELPSTEEGNYISGVQFFIDSHGSSQAPYYFRYKWEENYEIRVPFPSQFEWSDSLQRAILRNPVNKLERCYTTDYSSETILGSTAGQSENRMSEFPIRFVEERSRPLGHRYSIEVRQYAVGEEVYRFYKNLKENNEGSGSFFDKQKGFVQGNIYSPDSDEPVLGVFEVAGVSVLRSFFSPGQFPGLKSYERDFCEFPSELIISPFELPQMAHQLGGWLIYTQDFLTGQFIFLPSECSDCRHDGSLDKPPFWVD